MILKITIAAIVFASMVACENAPEDLFVRHFVVREGEHYSTPRLAETLQSKRFIFTAEFNESAIYDFGDQALQSNKNKLMGFADCNSMHHENSARFGWQWFNNRLEIYAYCYVNSQRVEEFVGVVNLNEKNRYEIELTESSYTFYLNGEKKATINRSSEINDTGVYYLLYPYFGGSAPAQHDVSINVQLNR